MVGRFCGFLDEITRLGEAVYTYVCLYVCMYPRGCRRGVGLVFFCLASTRLLRMCWVIVFVTVHKIHNASVEECFDKKKK